MVDDRADTWVQACSVRWNMWPLINQGTEHESQLQHLLASVWNSPAGFCKHLAHFDICLHIIFVTTLDYGGHSIRSSLWCKQCHGYGPNYLYHLPQCYEKSKLFILSLWAAPPTDMFETLNWLSTVTQRDIQKLSHLGMKYKVLLLGYQEEITQHHAVYYCL